ncbi:MAG TPA: CHAD domain-containing protein [Chloroflexota bacterium]
MAPARPIRDLSCDEPFRSAAAKTIWTRFDEMMSHCAAALEGSDPEGVHDMRVGSRRLRAAIELYRDVFPARRLKPYLNEVKRVADALGDVRDGDVMLERLQADRKGRPPTQQLVLKELLETTENELVEARKRLKSVLDELEHSDFARQFLTFVARETE